MRQAGLPFLKPLIITERGFVRNFETFREQLRTLDIVQRSVYAL